MWRGGAAVVPSFRTAQQRTLFAALAGYRDVLYTAREVAGGTAMQKLRIVISGNTEYNLTVKPYYTILGTPPQSTE